MKKFKMSTSIIIIVVSVAVIVGIYFLISNYLLKDEGPTDVQVSAVQNILLRNMENDYPPTPKEVLKHLEQTLSYSRCEEALLEEFYEKDGI